MDNEGYNKVWRVCILYIAFLLVVIIPFALEVNGQIYDPNYNYSLNDASYNWLDPPSSVTSFSLGDDSSVPVDFSESALDFHFSFYGLSVETLYISSNGYLTLEGGHAADRYFNNDLTVGTPMLDIIAPFWDDLKPITDPNMVPTKICAWLDSNSPRRFIIQYDSIGRCELSSSMRISFEVILYEEINKILFQYKDVTFDPNDSDDYSFGKSATVGLRSVQEDGMVFFNQFSYNHASLEKEDAISFFIYDKDAPFIIDLRPQPSDFEVIYDPNIHTDPDNPFIHFILQDFSSGVDTKTVKLSIDKKDIPLDANNIIPLDDPNSPHRVSVSYCPTEPFNYSQIVEIRIEAADKAKDPNGNLCPNELDYIYSFGIEPAASDPNSLPFILPDECFPKPQASDVVFDANNDSISFILQDKDQGVDISSIIVFVDGNDVSQNIITEESVEDGPKKITVSYYCLDSDFTPGQEIAVNITAADLDSLPNWMPWYTFYFTMKAPSGDIEPPYIYNTIPYDGAVNVSKDEDIEIFIFDDLYEKESGVDPGEIKLWIDGNEVLIASTNLSITPMTDNRNLRIIYNHPQDFAYGQTVEVTVAAKDYANNSLQADGTFSFTIEPNYSLNFCPYQWINPPDPNSCLLTQITEQGVEEIDFDFMFYNQQVGTIFISKYGYITLEDDFLNELNSDLIKTSPLQPPENIIAPFWDYLSYQSDPNALQTKVYAWLDGNSSQRLIVQWNFIDHYYHFTDDGISFEVILNGEDNTIEFYYKDVFFSSVGDNPIYNDGYSFGQSATIGLRSIQNGHTLAQQYSYLGQELLYDHMGLLFNPSYLDSNAPVSDSNAPILIKVSPFNNENVLSDPNSQMSDPNIQMDPNNPFIRFTLQDFESGVDPNSIRLYIQGRDVTRQITEKWAMEDPNDNPYDPNSWIKVGEFENTGIDCTTDTNNVKVSYILPTSYSYGQIIFVGATAADKADPPNWMDLMENTFCFSIPDQSPPSIEGQDPSAEWLDPNSNITYYEEVDPNTGISFYLIDDESGLDLNSLQLTVNGIDVTDTDPNRITTVPDDPNEAIYFLQVSYDPFVAFQDGNVTVEVKICDNIDPNNPNQPNCLEAKYAFKVVSPSQAPGTEFYYLLEKTPVIADATWYGDPDPYWLSLPSDNTPLVHDNDPNKPISDDDFYKIDLDAENFNFEFFGQKVNTLYISSNGYLAFEDDPNAPDVTPDADNYSNQDLTLWGTPQNIIAPYWDDLYPNPNIPTKIYSWTDSSDADAAYLAVRWESIGHYFNWETDDSISFEVRLYEKTTNHPNKIQFLYDDVIFRSSEDGYSHGLLATIGIRSVQGDQIFSQQYTHNGNQLVYDKTVLSFTVGDPNNLAMDNIIPYITANSCFPEQNDPDALTSTYIEFDISDAPGSSVDFSGINCQSIRLFVDENEFDPNYDYPLEDDVTYWTSISTIATQGEKVQIFYNPPNNFPYNQSITVYVIAADMAGNVMVDHYSFFTAVDDTEPVLQPVIPERGETDVSADTTIVFHIMDESGIDPNSIQVWINDSNNPIPYTDPNIEVLADDTVRVVYDPEQDFEEGETVEVVVEASDLSTDPNGPNRMHDEYEFTIYSPYVLDSFLNQYKPTFHKYEWIERPEGIEPLDLGVYDNDDDDDYAEVVKENIGFDFFFFDILVDKLLISSNGYITISFDNDRADLWENNDLNTKASPKQIIAPFWDDLNPEMGGKIYAWCDSNSPKRYIIQWDSFCRYDLHCVPQDPAISFEVVIYEKSDFVPEINNEIVFQYKDVFFNSVNDGFSFGQSASVGLRTYVGEEVVSRQYSYNGQYWLLDGMAIGFDPDPNQTLPLDVDAPYVLNCSPEQYDPNVTAESDFQMDPNNPFIQFTIQDPNFVSGVDIDTVKLYVQNQDVTDEVTRDPSDANIILYENTLLTPMNDGEDIRVSYIPLTAFSLGQRVSVLAAASDMADPPNWMAYEYYFTIYDPNANISGPHLAEQNPDPNDAQVSPSTGIVFSVIDEDEGVDQSSIQLLVWGVDVTDEAAITPKDDSHNILVEYQPLYPFDYGEEVEVNVVAYDLADPPNKLDVEYTFTILIPEAFYYKASFIQNELIEIDPNDPKTKKLFHITADPNEYEVDFDDSYSKIFLNDPNYADPNFNFKFFGIPVNYLYVSSNGYLTFDEDSALMYINNDLNYYDYPFNIIAPFWDDLKPFTHSVPDPYSTESDIYADIYAWSDGNRYIIRWDNMGHYNCSDDPNLSISFDVILHAGSNRIDFQYNDSEFSYLEDGYNYGQSASIGLRSIQESVFSQAYSYNVPSLYNDQNQEVVRCISFMPIEAKPPVIRAPEVLSWSPKDDPNVPISPDPNIYILIQDAELIQDAGLIQDADPGVDLNEIRLHVQGNDVTDQAGIKWVDGDANRIEIFYKPSAAFVYSQTVTVSVAVIYGIDFPYWMFDAYSFTVMDETAEQAFEDETPPELVVKEPAEGEMQVSPFTSIELYITDDNYGDSGVDPNSIYLGVWVDGNSITGETAIIHDPNDNRNITVFYDPNKPFGFGQTVLVDVTAKDFEHNVMVGSPYLYDFTTAPDYIYSFDPNGAEWLDPANPNEACTGIDRDDGYKEIDFTPEGFNFSFYGQEVETLYISSNGYLTFGYDSPIMYNNINLDPNNTVYPDNIIAPYWDDLQPYTDPNKTKIYAWLDANSSPRRYIIQWDSIGHYDPNNSDPNASITFEAILYENDNKIIFQYKDVIFNLDDPNKDGYSKGRSATVGIRSVQEGQVSAQQYSYNQPKLKNNLAISFFFYDLNVIKLTPDPSSENISPNTAIEFEIYDPNSELDLDSVKLFIDGNDVSGDAGMPFERDPNSSNILVRYEPSTNFSYGQTIFVYITASDMLNPANERNYGYSLTVEPSPIVVIPQFVYEVWQPEEFVTLGLDAIPILDTDPIAIGIHIKNEGGTGINNDPNFIQWKVEYSDGNCIPVVPTYIIEEEGGLTVWCEPSVKEYKSSETISVHLQVEDLAGNKAPECKFSFMTKAGYAIDDLMTMAYDDMHEKFWIGTDGGGLWAFDLSDKYWDPNFYTKDNGLLGNRISSMVLDDDVDEERFLWIVTNPNGDDPGGITQFNTESKLTVSTYLLSEINNDLEYINDLAIDENNGIWVATQNSGVWQLIETQDPAGRSWEQFADSNTLSVDFVENIAVNGNAIWWVGGSWADNCWKICKCEGSNVDSRNVDPNNLTLTSGKVKPVKSLFCDVEGNVCIATQENGIYRYNGDNLSALSYPDIDFNNDIIYATYVAGEHMDYRYWFATDKGISAFTADWGDSQSFTWEDLEILGIEAGCIINSFIADGAGDIWLGTTNGLYPVDIDYLLNII